MQILKFYGMVLLTIVLCVNFTACSEGEESENTEISGLKEILVGVWVQDGDDDIFVFNADGTGFVYANEESYLDNSYYTLLSWTNNNEWIYIDIPYYNQKEELRPESVSINKIVWRRYVEDNYVGDDCKKDAFGTYWLWTCERYTK